MVFKWLDRHWCRLACAMTKSFTGSSIVAFDLIDLNDFFKHEKDSLSFLDCLVIFALNCFTVPVTIFLKYYFNFPGA